MADVGAFENLIPSQFICFTFPNPIPSANSYNDLLRIAVLDSPAQTSDSPKIAALIVPKDREDDWIFSTETGHLQIISNSPGISRLILVGNLPPDSDNLQSVYSRPIREDSTCRTEFEESLMPLLIALSPKSSFVRGFPEIPFLTYEDDVIRSVLVEKCVGSCVGEMLIEDVEIDPHDKLEEVRIREFRRRLRFKRMPNLVQTEMRIVPSTILGSSDVGIGEVEFQLDTSCLVHPYLPPMVAGLSLISPYLEDCAQSGSRPRVACVGVGGGSLLTFLRTQLGFEVFGVESDEAVLGVAKRYFGFVEGELLRVCIGDGIEFLKDIAGPRLPENINFPCSAVVETDGNIDVFNDHNRPFDVIMVDLDSKDTQNGFGAPPLGFSQKPVLLAAKKALHKNGILVLNVIPQTKCLYNFLTRAFLEVFSELYEINVGNEENYVIIAAVSPIRLFPSDTPNSIFKMLELAIPRKYIDSIRKLKV